jgi:hypothetical protein
MTDSDVIWIKKVRSQLEGCSGASNRSAGSSFFSEGNVVKEMSTIKIRLVLGLTAAVTVLSLACSGDAARSAVEPQANGSEGQQEAIDGGPVSIPVPDAKLSGDSVETDTSNMTAMPNADESGTSADASAEPQTPSPALTVVARNGTTQMEQNPVLEAAIPRWPHRW